VSVYVQPVLMGMCGCVCASQLVFPAFATVEAATELREFMTFHVEPLMDLKAKMYDSDRVLQMLLEVSALRVPTPQL
jgi:hypothetical protein